MTFASFARRSGILAALACLPVQAQTLGSAQDAYLLTDLLPTGRSAARVEARYGYANQILAPNGDHVPLFGAANNLAIDARTIPLLGLFGPGATLGTTQVQTHASGQRYRMTFGFGVNDDLTVGAMLPWGRIDNRVDFAVAGANLAANPYFNAAAAIGPANSPFAPLAMLPPGTPAAGTADIQRVLSDPAYGYGYKPIGNVRHEGLLDPVIGLRWRIAADATSATVLAPALRIGNAQKRDPDQIFDMRLEEGTTDLILGLEHIRQIGERGDLSLAGKYTRRTRDTLNARARGVGEFLVPQSRTETLDRRMGDIFEAAVEAGYRIDAWRLAARLDYSGKAQDRYHSARGQDVSGLEADTAGHSYTAWLGANWSGLKAYEAGRLPIPLFFSVYYRHALSGKNDILTRDWYLTLTSVF